jgi:hypothetical protein
VLPVVTSALAKALDLDRQADALDPRLRPGAAIVLHRDAGGRVAVMERIDG